MAPKLRPRLKPVVPAEPPRNSFTSTDYYRPTREEYYSPISKMEFSSPGSPYADLPDEGSPTSSTRLAHIHEESFDEREAAEAGAARVPKRTSMFWHVFYNLFGKWLRYKEGNKHRESPHAPRL